VGFYQAVFKVYSGSDNPRGWQKEVEMYNKLQRNRKIHDNIVRMLGSFQQHNLSYIVLEYANGLTLEDHFKGRPEFHSAQDIEEFFKQLVLGLYSALNRLESCKMSVESMPPVVTVASLTMF